MNILAIDTSSSWGSVAAARDNRITCITYLDIRVTHSERLMMQIDNCLSQSGLELDNIDLLVISNGPGSFTGLRIGLATVKGICTAKEIPLYPVNSLYALAYNMYGCQSNIIPFVDAKMNEVYAALYDKEMKEKIPPHCTKPEIFLEQIKQPAIIIGDGVNRYKELIAGKDDILRCGLVHQNSIIASSLISIVINEGVNIKYDFEAISDLEPYYSRKSQAEKNLEQKLTSGK